VNFADLLATVGLAVVAGLVIVLAVIVAGRR
jgi:hypothetical protein